MAEWITPIFDRTITDVELAIKTINDWKESGNVSMHDLKGCLNYTDLNRIENNVQYLSETIVSLGYKHGTQTRKWTRGDIPTAQDILRISNNIKAMINAFCQMPSAPPLTDDLSTYNSINSVEENLYLLREVLLMMVYSFKKSNSVKSGSKISLPKWR